MSNGYLKAHWVKSRAFILILMLVAVVPSVALAAQIGTVSQEYAEVKNAPNDSATTVEVLSKGAKLTLSDGMKNGYFRARTRKSAGWISSSSVRASKGARRGVASESGSSSRGRFYYDGIFGYGYSGLAFPGVSSPTLTQVTFGGSIGYSIQGFFFGASTDYRLIQQQSAVGNAGNCGGSRWNMISPMIGAKFNGWLLKLDFEFMGNYNLANSTGSNPAPGIPPNANVSYSNPIGARLLFLAPVFPALHLKAGLMGEYLQFSSQIVSGQSTVTLSSPLVLWQIGGVVGLFF